MSEKFSSGTWYPKQKNKNKTQTKQNTIVNNTVQMKKKQINNYENYLYKWDK